MIMTANVYAVLTGLIDSSSSCPVTPLLFGFLLCRSSNMTGEWRGTTTRPRVYMAGGLLVLLVAVVVIAVGAI